LARVTHVSDLAVGDKTEIAVQIAFTDGFGRDAQKKALVEAGPAPLRDAGGKLILDGDGKPTLGDVDPRWLVSGRVVYNNKGKP